LLAQRGAQPLTVLSRARNDGLATTAARRRKDDERQRQDSSATTLGLDRDVSGGGRNVVDAARPPISGPRLPAALLAAALRIGHVGGKQRLPH
jgi:hypothetical protein